MPVTQTLNTKPLGQVPTNTKDEINSIVDQLLEPFQGDLPVIPIAQMPQYLGTILKAAQVAPKALEILANFTTIEANMVSIAHDIQEIIRGDRLQCICDELKCLNSLLKQHLTSLDADQRQKLDSIRVLHAGLNQIAVTVAAASQAYSIEELPKINATNPNDSTFATDYLLPESTDQNDRVKCNQG